MSDWWDGFAAGFVIAGSLHMVADALKEWARKARERV